MELIRVGDVIFNPAAVILATKGRDDSLLLTMQGDAEHYFAGPEALQVWEALVATTTQKPA